MLPEYWASGIKQAFGTSYEAYDAKGSYSAQSPTAPISKVWFTVAQGILTEVYWPLLDRPQIRDLQFLVTDGRSFFWEERRDGISDVQWVETGVPAFRVTTRDVSGLFRLEKTIFTDPDLQAVRMKVKFLPNQPGLKLYVLYNPTAGGTPMSNHALSGASSLAPGSGLFAWDGDQAQALVASVPLEATSVSFSGGFDLYQDLSRDYSMDFKFTEAHDGNVVAGAEIDYSGSGEFELALGFGSTIGRAHQTALSSLQESFETALERFSAQWRGYQSKLLDLAPQSLDGGKRFRASTAMLKSMEDKSFAGAVVASPSIPWGIHQVDWTRNGDPLWKKVGGYHLIWPRDLYQMATTWLAVGDFASARAAFDRLRTAQLTDRDGFWEYGFRRRSRDGSFMQNFWIDGSPYWQGLQMDETAFPVILTYRLWKAGEVSLADTWDMVRRAADFLTDYGPWTGQERWEENFGASPATIASEIAALYCASEIAHAQGDDQRAQRYLKTADAWSSKPGDNLETWTFTQSGALGNGSYFIRMEAASRVDQFWNPNDNATITIANGGPTLREKDVLDGGFLELVRLGVRDALDPSIVETIPEYDSNLRVIVPGRGPSYYRYTADRYNYDEGSGRQTHGMLWPLLTGERGHYQLAVAAANHASKAERDRAILPFIAAMEAFATPSLMIPEQVWDKGPAAGQPTGAATPLGWSHAEYIKLLRSRKEGQVFDILPVVLERSRQLGITRRIESLEPSATIRH
jgi:glucoamylase